jgi:hypothetical protein
MFCFIDDVLSLTNSRFGDLFYRINPIGIEIKDIPDTERSDSHLDLHIKTERLSYVPWFVKTHRENSSSKS